MLAAPNLDVVLCHHAIADVLHLYCRGCDRADEAALRACFHPDSVHRHGSFVGTSADFCALALEIVRPLKACKHMISNIMIERKSGSLAFCEAHYLSYHRRTDEAGADEDYFAGGRYLDRFEQRGGAWKIAERVGLIDFERYEAPADRTLWAGPAERRGGKFPDDVLYRKFMGQTS